MFRKLSKQESGYSLIEVMVSIIILTFAIIPMVGMFDMGLHSASTSSNYDNARMLANANLEKVRSLPYSSAINTYKPVNADPADANRKVTCNQGIFTCSVQTTYVDDDFNPSSASTTKMQVVVTVTWNGSNYTTTGLKAK